MTTSEKLIKIAENVQKNVEFGKSQGGGGDAQIILDCMGVRAFQWQNAVFPEGFNLVFKMKATNGNNNIHDFNASLFGATGIKTAKFICEEYGTILMNQFIRNSSVEVLDLSECNRIPTDISYFAMANTKLIRVLGEIDMTSCTKVTHPFNSTSALEEIRFKEGTITIALDFHWSIKLSAESYDSIIKGHSKTASVTLTLPAETTVRSVFDAKFGSGAWDTITAQYPNVTIMYS